MKIKLTLGGMICIIVLGTISTSLLFAVAPVEERSVTTSPDTGVTTRVVTQAPVLKKPVSTNENPLLPSKVSTSQVSWLSQVNEIKNKYHLRRKHIFSTFRSQFARLNAYELTRLEKYKSKQALIDGTRKVNSVYLVIKAYRINKSKNKQYFIDAYNYINTDQATRNKLIGILKRSLNSRKAKSQDQLLYLEERMFYSLLSVYKVLKRNPTMWNIKNGAFDFKNDRLKARYQSNERELNNSIRKLQSQREMASEKS